MAMKFFACLVLCLAASISSQVKAQNVGNMINMFTTIMRGAIIDNARIEWSRIPPTEATCIDQVLQQQGVSIGALIQNGIAPADPRVANIRYGCRTATATPRSTDVSKNNIQDLSTKPTFDCTRARSATARIICLDQAGANADWDLITSYWAKYYSLPESERNGFDQAQENWLKALNQACQLSSQQDTFLPTQQQCVLTAYTRRAAGYRSQLNGDARAESKLTPEQHAGVQLSLIARGFLNDNADGQFGPKTRAAIQQFQTQSGFSPNDFLTAQQREQLLQSAPPSTTTSPAGPTAPPPPPKDTLQLKEARIFLEDIKQFIAKQTDVPSLSEIATESANLQRAVSQYDEKAAAQAKQKLTALLTPISGFTEFEDQQKADRDRVAARALFAAKDQSARNIYFIDAYMKGHLGSEHTSSLLSLRQAIQKSQSQSDIDEINKENAALQSYVKTNGLLDVYTELLKSYSDQPNLEFGPKTSFIGKAANQDIILFYNASGTAPNVWQTVQGDIAFQNNTASICFAQRDPDMLMVRYVENVIRQQGAAKVSTQPQQCDFSRAATSIDIMAFQVVAFRKEERGYSMTLVKLVEDEVFRTYRTLGDFPSFLHGRDVLSQQIEKEVDSNGRSGFGVIDVRESNAVCIIGPVSTDQMVGLKQLMTENRGMIAPKLGTDWSFVQADSDDLGFRSLQRQECGYVAGEINDVRSIMLALRRNNIGYYFSPVWWNSQELKTAAGRAPKPVPPKGLAPPKGPVVYSPKARGYKNAIQDIVNALAAGKDIEGADLFPTYLNWITNRLEAQWQTSSVDTDISDFGTAQWEHRPVDAILIKSIIHQKNAPLGKYEDRCFLFGALFDNEFNFWRAPIAVDCDDATSVRNWESSKSFQSTSN